MRKKIIPALQHQKGAVGLLSVILLTTLVLLFVLTIAWQIVLNVKNAKLLYDFNKTLYVTEAGMRDARMQLKKEAVSSKVFQNLALENITVTRKALFNPASMYFSATGTSGFISRTLVSTCESSMAGCTLDESKP